MSQPAVQAFTPTDLPLRDYHLPSPVSWWPPAPGWWWVLFIGLGLAVVALLIRKHWLRQAWRRDGRRRLAVIEAAYSEHGDGHRLARDVSVLIRRICLTRFPVDSGSHLHGSEWLENLDNLVGRRHSGRVFFRENSGRELLRATCDPAGRVDGKVLLAVCREWLEALPSAGRSVS